MIDPKKRRDEGKKKEGIHKSGVYVHIPFCEKKCAYCDFLSGPAKKEEQYRYVAALCREIREEGRRLKEERALGVVDTVFFGGGTPSLLDPRQIRKVMEALHEAFCIEERAEISLEVNPGTVDRMKLEEYRRLGINRLSIGLQSMDNDQLRELGRIHDREDFLRTWELIRELGFSNVNVDLMSALPGQTLKSYERTLREVLKLEPEHISAYSLIIEEGTLFFERFSPGREEEGRLPSEEEDRGMYLLTDKLLKASGYHRYEISNYSKPGYECRHNLGYWTRKEYLGLGLGASSFLDKVRFSRERDLAEYIQKVEEGRSSVVWQEKLELCEEMEEFMFLGLRCTRGVSPEEFLDYFSVGMEEVYAKQLKELGEKGLLRKTAEGRFALTALGLDVSNQVFVEFLLEEEEREKNYYSKE